MSKHLYAEKTQDQTKHSSGLLQLPYKPGVLSTENGLTSRTPKGQFVKPGVIDHRYRMSDTALHSQRLSQTETVGPVSPAAKGHIRLIPEAVQARVKSNASWDGTGPTCYTSMRSPLVTLTRQYLILLGVMLAEYRSTWFIHVLNGLLVPISFTFFVVAVGGVTNTEKAIYLLGGNMALSIAIGPTAFLINKLGWARQSQEFDYWIALPLSKMMMMFALVSVALLFALPGLVGTYVVASLLFRLPFNASAWILIPLVPLAVLPLAGVGAMLGTIAPSGQVASVLGNIVLLFAGILSPLMLPIEALPVPLRITSQFVPTTYVADAFRTVLRGHIGSNLVFDVIILALFSAVLLTLTYFRLDWRNT